MCPVLVQPNTNTINVSWNELFVESNAVPFTWQFLRGFIENLWPKIVSFLGTIKDIEIAYPTDNAWFHVRRSPCNGNEIDVLRLKDGFISDNDKEKIRLLAEKNPEIIHAKWRSWPPQKRHDNAFLSFLQKLSVLRIRDEIRIDEYLGNISANPYDKCPYCREAYNVMMTPNSKWYIPLTPWFDYISATKMDTYRIREYAHWFGHILSGWHIST
jgi:hypothetical protein